MHCSSAVLLLPCGTIFWNETSCKFWKVHYIRDLWYRIYLKFTKIQFKSAILKQKIAEIPFKMTKCLRNSMKIDSKLHRIYVKRSKNHDLPSNMCFETDFNHKNHQTPLKMQEICPRLGRSVIWKYRYRSLELKGYAKKSFYSTFWPLNRDIGVAKGFRAN